MMRWHIENITHLLHTPDKLLIKTNNTLAELLPSAHTASLLKCRKLLGLMYSITPEVPGAQGIFTQLQHALTLEKLLRVTLSHTVQDKLDTWRHLMDSLYA